MSSGEGAVARRWLARILAVAVLGCSSASGGGDGAEPGDLAGDPTVDAALEAETGTPCAYSTRHAVPGPCETGWEPDLDAKARRFDRAWTLFNAGALGINTDVGIASEADRTLIDDFVKNGDGWDAEFEAETGRKPLDLVTSPNKVAGLYAGVGIVADAYRYGILRDQGYPAAEVEQARKQLLRALETLHVATAITGVPGVIARGLALAKWNETWKIPLVPLKDENGKPLPEVKNNGAWRADNSAGGLYPHLIWEDSVSRDMLVGWASAFGAAWEVIGEDPAFPQAVKDTLRTDARDLGRALKVVRASGYDLEVPDADGRTTLHGWLNEHNMDGQFYLEGLENGFHAVMALGIVAAYAYASGDPGLSAWLHDDLVTKRQLPRIVKEQVHVIVDLGYGSNFSNYNMAFQGAWLAFRYLDDDGARATLREGLRDGLYDRPGREFQPIRHGYALYDLTYALGMADASAFAPTGAAYDEAAVERGLDTLRRFPSPPYWDREVVNCPILETFECGKQYAETEKCRWDAKLLTEPCTAVDGKTLLKPLGCMGWKCTDVVDAATPWEVKPPSNYHWRSAPHGANGGGNGASLLPGVDFRFAYWMGRWARR